MSRLSRSHVEEDESSIDLTPMLDVVFIMLIFFIVTASFIKEAGIQIQRPDASNNEEKSEIKNIVLEVSANDEIWLAGRRIDIRSVRANVQRLYAQNPNASVIIKAAPSATTATLTMISDHAREANIYNISLVIDEH